MLPGTAMCYLIITGIFRDSKAYRVLGLGRCWKIRAPWRPLVQRVV